MSNPIVIPRERLYEEYINKKRSSAQIAQDFHTNSTTILAWLKRYKIKARTVSEAANKGSKNGMWKGDKVGYNALHDWVKYHKPKSMFCEKCGKIIEKLDCANISGEYKRDISDWRWLCRKCHMEEDGRLSRINEFNTKTKISKEEKKKRKNEYNKEYRKKYYQKNKDKIKLQRKGYYQKNKDIMESALK